MTRVSGTYRIGYRAGSHFPTHSKRAGTSRLHASPEASSAEEAVVEEVIFEPDAGVDQRSAKRGFVVSEIREEELKEAERSAVQKANFWNNFSTPFMAQVIGQSGDNDEEGLHARRKSGQAYPAARRPLLRAS